MNRSALHTLYLSMLLALAACASSNESSAPPVGLDEVTDSGVASLPVAGAYLSVTVEPPVEDTAPVITGKSGTGSLTGQWTRPVDNQGTITEGAIIYSAPASFATPLAGYEAMLANSGNPSTYARISSYSYVKVYDFTYQDNTSMDYINVRTLFGIQPDSLPEDNSATFAGRVSLLLNISDTSLTSTPDKYYAMGGNAGIRANWGTDGTVYMTIDMDNIFNANVADTVTLTSIEVENLAIDPTNRSFGSGNNTAISIVATAPDPDDDTNTLDLDFSSDTSSGVQGWFFGNPAGLPEEVGGYLDSSGTDGSIIGIFIAH